jgi:hypothetical protein
MMAVRHPDKTGRDVRADPSGVRGTPGAPLLAARGAGRMKRRRRVLWGLPAPERRELAGRCWHPSRRRATERPLGRTNTASWA